MFIGRFNGTVSKTTSGFYRFNFYKRISNSNAFNNFNCFESKCVYKDYSTNVEVAKNSQILDKKNETLLNFDESGVIKCTKDQWLYKPTAKEIDLFLNSKIIPSKPINLEHSVVVNLVDLNKDVASPVRNAVYFSEYGVRKGESIRLFIAWIIFTSITTYLGIWQLNRKKWKEDLLQNINESLSLPKITINSMSDIKSKELETKDSGGLLYRIIETQGVLDTQHQFLVGPRQSMIHEHGEQSGYYVLYPLRFRDGSVMLVNMGWLKGDDVFNMKVTPEWVTVRGVLVRGEVVERVILSLKYKFLSTVDKIVYFLTKTQLDLSKTVNKPSSIVRSDEKKAYRYLDPESISSQVFSTEPSLTRRYVLNVYDSYFEDDKPLGNSVDHSGGTSTLMTKMMKFTGINKSDASTGAKTPLLPRYRFQRKKKSDYLLFYADPGTHFNYALQWFLMAVSVTCLCVYKMFRVRKVLRKLNR